MCGQPSPLAGVEVCGRPSPFEGVEVCGGPSPSADVEVFNRPSPSAGVEVFVSPSPTINVEVSDIPSPSVAAEVLGTPSLSSKVEGPEGKTDCKKAVQAVAEIPTLTCGESEILGDIVCSWCDVGEESEGVFHGVDMSDVRAWQSVVDLIPWDAEQDVNMPSVCMVNTRRGARARSKSPDQSPVAVSSGAQQPEHPGNSAKLDRIDNSQVLYI